MKKNNVQQTKALRRIPGGFVLQKEVFFSNSLSYLPGTGTVIKPFFTSFTLN